MQIFKQIAKKIEGYDSIVIFHHIRPDGDCLGSQFGLKKLILENFSNKKVYAVGDKKGMFPFLNFVHDLIPKKEILQKSLGIIVDANFQNRIQNLEILADLQEIMRIDHHVSEDDLPNCNLRWVEPDFSAAAEQIAFLAKNLSWKISQEAATFLLLGIWTDSGSLTFNSVVSRTFEVVAFLMQNQAKLNLITTNLKKVSLMSLKIKNFIISHAMQKKKVIYFYFDLVTQKNLGIFDPLKAAMPNVLANIEGFPIWAFFVEEDKNKIRCEFRSNKISVRSVAVKYGGGGHEFAAGAQISDAKNIPEIVADLEKLVQ